jgi:hypothetical protein
MHEHLRSYVGQAKVSLHSAVRQLELARDAFLAAPLPGHLLMAAADVDDLLEQLVPLRDTLISTHKQVVKYT